MPPIPFPAGIMVMQLVFLAVPVGAMAFFGWLALRYVRARERDSAARTARAPAAELDHVEETMRALRAEVAALRERQDFIERLLERPRAERTVRE